MTVKQLKDSLSQYPDDMNVKVSCDVFVRNVADVTTVVDMDTNIVSVDICGEDYRYKIWD